MQGVYWKAVYNDGTELPQITANGKTNKYPDIDRENLKYFEIMHGNRLLFRLHLEPGRRLIVRRRTISSLMNPNDKQVVWMVGWQWGAKCTDCGKSRNVQDIAWVFEDGHVELTGQFKEMPYGSPGKLMDCEEKLIGGNNNEISESNA